MYVFHVLVTLANVTKVIAKWNQGDRREEEAEEDEEEVEDEDEDREKEKEKEKCTQMPLDAHQ